MSIFNKKTSILGGAVVFSCFVSWTANSADPQTSIVGTWQLIDYSQEFVDTKQVSKPYGEHPTGYIQYSPGGHVVVFLTSGELPKPASPMYTDAERVAFHKGIIGAYAGTYSVEGKTVTHHILTAWRPDWIGGDQTRFFELDGKSLVIKTAPIKFSQTGQDIVSSLTFIRAE